MQVDSCSTNKRKFTSNLKKALFDNEIEDNMENVQNNLNADPNSKTYFHNYTSWEGFSKKEIIVLLLETIEQLGYKKTFNALQDETGVLLHTREFNLFHNHILSGNWNLALYTLQNNLYLDDIIKSACTFLIIEHKFFELIISDHLKDALICLREELSQASFDDDTTNRLHECSCSFMTLNSNHQILSSNHHASRTLLWQKILMLLPPHIFPPPKRLFTLLNQAYKYQELHCLYHNTSQSTNYSHFYSLLQDHQCSKESLPNTAIATLDKHTDEVWYVSISNTKNYIVSSSKDKTVILWESHPPFKFVLPLS